MNRDKVLELAREGGLVHQWQTHGEQHDILKTLERFAVLIEREVSGDAEPVAYETDQELWAADDPDINDWIKQNGRPLYTRPAPAASAESVASVHIKDGCLIGSQRKSGVDIPDGQYALYPIGTSPAPAVGAEPVARLRFYKGEVVVTKDYETVERNGEFDVYTHPTPAVVRQLVEALSRMTSVFLDTEGSYGSHETDAMDFAEAALAAANGYTA